MHMNYLFCKIKLSFFPYAIKDHYAEWPNSGVDISDDEYHHFLSQQKPDMVIGADSGGHPIWVKKPELSIHEKSIAARALRDAEISSSMWVAERHRGQLQLSLDTTITNEQYTQLLVYHQFLRDWPTKPGWPDINMPEKPAWLDVQN